MNDAGHDRIDTEGWHILARTHVGLRRSSNQDYFGQEIHRDGARLIVVADGMGGHAGGERASRLAVEEFLVKLRDGSVESADGIEATLRSGIESANERVRSEAAADSSLKGMGATVVGAVLKGDRAHIVNLGDSRAYRFGNEGLRQLTFDHSMVGELLRKGELTPEEAANHPRRNVITRAVGVAEGVAPELFETPLTRGEILLLCSDGLHGMIGDDEIARILGTDWPLAAKCDALIDAALDAGGGDNVTVMLALAGEDAGSSGPDTDPGTGAVAEAAGIDSSGKNERPGINILYGLAILAVLLGVAWLIWGNPFAAETVETPAVDSTLFDGGDSSDILLDSSHQLTPSDMVNDSVWSDSLSEPAVNREPSR